MTRRKIAAKSVFHGFGIGTLTTAVILQFLVFWTIYTQGFFRAIEQNTHILKLELSLAVFAGIYMIVIVAGKVKRLS